MIEHQLEAVIKNSLRPAASNTEAEILFSDKGLMGSFSEKIWGAYFMRLIGPKTRLDLDIIRKMRNECAHNMNPISFEIDPIASWLRELRPAVDIDDQDRTLLKADPRHSFALICHGLIEGLMLRSAGHETLNTATTVKHILD